MEHFAGTIALIGLVIVVASLLSGALERAQVPVVAVFLGLGLLLGPWGLGLVDIGLSSPTLAALATLALTLVLFSDAVTVSKKDLGGHRRLLWRLLGPGTLVPAVLVALAARLVLAVSWPSAFVLGAALASTDPVLLRGMLRSSALPPIPRVALRIETGMNDVVLLPIVAIAMLFMTPGSISESAAITRSLLGLFLLGPLTGALVGWIGIILLARIRATLGMRRDYESLYALGLAFTAYALAEAVGGSGFLAAFAAGLLVALQDIELCDCFREYGDATAEMLLLLTFVALGTRTIWSGLAIIDARTIAFTAIALSARALVLYPVLSRAGVHGRDRKLIALFGPRGLSSLLLALLPVFAGIAAADQLFAIACLVVLVSLVLHGGGIGMYLQSARRAAAAATPAAQPEAQIVPDAAALDSVPEKITIGDLEALRRTGEPVVIVDARADRSWHESDLTAEGSQRVNPEDPVRDAKTLRLSQRATLVVYCA